MDSPEQGFDEAGLDEEGLDEEGLDEEGLNEERPATCVGIIMCDGVRAVSVK